MTSFWILALGFFLGFQWRAIIDDCRAAERDKEGETCETIERWYVAGRAFCCQADAEAYADWLEQHNETRFEVHHEVVKRRKDELLR